MGNESTFAIYPDMLFPEDTNSEGTSFAVLNRVPYAPYMNVRVMTLV
jgi:hypothetical protein